MKQYLIKLLNCIKTEATLYGARLKISINLENNASLRDYLMVLISIPPSPLPCFIYLRNVIKKNLKFDSRMFKIWRPYKENLYLLESHGYELDSF